MNSPACFPAASHSGHSRRARGPVKIALIQDGGTIRGDGWASSVPVDFDELFRKAQAFEAQEAAQKCGSIGSSDCSTGAISRWRYTPLNSLPLALREQPDLGAKPSGFALQPGEVIEVVEECEDEDGVCFLHLLDGRGWAFDRKPGVGTMCVRDSRPGPRSSDLNVADMELLEKVLDSSLEEAQQPQDEKFSAVSFDLSSPVLALMARWHQLGTLMQFQVLGEGCMDAEQPLEVSPSSGDSIRVTRDPNCEGGIVELDLSDSGIRSAGPGDLTELADALRSDTVLDKISCKSNSIDDSWCGWLRNPFLHNCTVRELVLSHNSLGDQGADVLADILRNNTSLRSLHLGNNCICSGGAGALAASLQRNCTLQELDLSSNEIGDEGAKWLAVAFDESESLCVLLTLNVAGNPIDVEGINTLTASFELNSASPTSTLETLHLGKTILRREDASRRRRLPGPRVEVRCTREGVTVRRAP